MFLLSFVRDNPLIFSYVIMLLYGLNILSGFVPRELDGVVAIDWFHVWYWCSALSITLCVVYKQLKGLG